MAMADKNSPNLNILKEAINEIQENAIQQYNVLPELKGQADTLDDEFRAVFHHLKILKNQEVLLKTATDLSNVKLQEQEVQQHRQSEELDKVEQDGTFYDHLMDGEREKIVSDIVKLEDTLMLLAESFRSAPLFYESENLGSKVDAVRQNAVKLTAKLYDLQNEIGCIKQHYNHQTARGTATGQDMQALSAIMSDSLLVDNIIDTISKKEEEYWKTLESLKRDLGQLQATKDTLQR